MYNLRRSFETEVCGAESRYRSLTAISNEYQKSEMLKFWKLIILGRKDDGQSFSKI